MKTMSTSSLAVELAVFGVLAITSLCAVCIARRAGIPLVVATAELRAMKTARALRGRPLLGPVDARCPRCEEARPVYRLCRDTANQRR
jgi:hypothetical protein